MLHFFFLIKVSGHLDYKQQLGTVMRAVGIQTKASPASSSSLDKASFAKTCASSTSSTVIIDELSSSDDDMFLEVVKPESGGERSRQTSLNCPPNHKGHQSESVSACVKGESEDSFITPESLSTDSGITSRLESESEEMLNSWDQLSVTSDHSCDLQYSGRKLAGKKDSNN